jgi:DNA-binding FadR family transcriptional regulator
MSVVWQPKEDSLDSDTGYHAALTQLRAFIAQRDSEASPRLPPERELCEVLGVSRGELRKALAILESEGQLWRHVGKGTFIGQRPVDEIGDVAALTNQTNPGEVMRARLLIEPAICREAALNATSADIAEMHFCIGRAGEAETWRQYENWDNRFHRAIAQATQNRLLVGLFDTLNAVRRAVVWGRLRTSAKAPDSSHHSFKEHEAIVAALEQRDIDLAGKMMRQHLESVESHLRRGRD